MFTFALTVALAVADADTCRNGSCGTAVAASNTPNAVCTGGACGTPTRAILGGSGVFQNRRFGGFLGRVFRGGRCR